VLDLIGGDRAIDFVNTLAATEERPGETLHTYADLVDWAEHAEVVAPDHAVRLREAAAGRPAEAAAVLAEAWRQRAQLDAVLRAVSRSASPPADAVAGVREAHLEALGHADLREVDGAYAWTFGTSDDLASPLWPIALRAVDLLRSDRLDKLRRCTDCRWLFLDLSRNHSRRWCRMRGCGARAKMRRYRASRSGV
jgi:predicted RNA-binding Zn ribbon-like protein